MLLFDIADFPHQSFEMTLDDGRTITIRLRYNQLYDRWSMTVWDDDICPIVAGRRILSGRDLFANVSSVPDSLVLLLRDGAAMLAGNEYQLLTKRVNGPLAHLALLSPDEVGGLRSGIVQPCC